MKILYTLNSGNPGGMEQHTLDLVREMFNRGHEVFVWCKEGVIKDWFEKAGALVVTHDISFDVDPVYIFSLRDFLIEKKIDVIHAHELKAVVNSLIAGWLTKTPVRISHTHTPISTWQVDETKKKINVFINSFVVNNLGTKEIALTESRKRIKAEEGIKEQKLVVIPNGIEISKYDLSDEQKQAYRKEVLQKYSVPQNAYVIGNISRMTEEKGHTILVEAFKKFMEYSLVDKENTYLFLAGGGKLENEIKAKAEELGISDKVVITGVFEEEMKLKFYSSFDTFVFPSLTEGFGLVLIEAMYMECPVICSDLKVLQEVGGSTVIYFETGNRDDLAEKMFNLYQKKDRLGDLPNSAKQRVLDLYTMEKFADAYENLYLGLAGE